MQTTDAHVSLCIFSVCSEGFTPTFDQAFCVDVWQVSLLRRMNKSMNLSLFCLNRKMSVRKQECAAMAVVLIWMEVSNVL